DDPDRHHRRACPSRRPPAVDARPGPFRPGRDRPGHPAGARGARLGRARAGTAPRRALDRPGRVPREAQLLGGLRTGTAPRRADRGAAARRGGLPLPDAAAAGRRRAGGPGPRRRLVRVARLAGRPVAAHRGRVRGRAVPVHAPAPRGRWQRRAGPVAVLRARAPGRDRRRPGRCHGRRCDAGAHTAGTCHLAGPDRSGRRAAPARARRTARRASAGVRLRPDRLRRGRGRRPARARAPARAGQDRTLRNRRRRHM
ncbi:MAG: Flavodoxin reductases (ferredoxin-NADPH reductases) family 1, partial [uncultured Frankineae bacterium]